jgi:hypothetical protein
MYPSTRHDELLVSELADETLIYDLQRHKAHCLNRTAAFVWQRCDGQTSVADIAAMLPAELGLPAEVDIVLLALERLEEVHLLREPLPSSRSATSISRRKLLAKLGVAGGAGLLLPVVTSILVPTPAMAASPMHTGELGCAFDDTNSKCGQDLTGSTGQCNPNTEPPHTCQSVTRGNIQVCTCCPGPKDCP